ncbi:hypothetical protein [Streptomyces sp. NPDC056549]|uniref:hypothetical protein n=1 Tax=Streptomyces sp. NPDC056549 TaxID=3345864 RepID=UPI0036A93004
MSSTPKIDPRILNFYAEVDEAGRLDRKGSAHLEYERTQELLRRHLPPGHARVIDIGGGPGAHAPPAHRRRPHR